MFGGNRTILPVTIASIAGLLALATLLNPDLALQLRTQIPVEITRVSKTLTWTPGSNIPAGDKTVTITATDDKGASVSKDITITVTGGVEGVSDVEALPEKARARIRWKTTSPTAPRVAFDLNNRLRKSQEDTVEDTDHEIVLDNLVACTNYTYQIVVTTSSQTVEDIQRTFTTLGCVGDAATKGLAQNDVPASQETTVSLPDKVAVRVPANTLPQEGHIQIHQLDRDQALAAVSVPEADLSPVTGMYEITAYSDANTKLASFGQPVTVTVNYTPSANTDTASLALWRHDGTSWSKLDPCTTDTGAQTVTCTTAEFSAVAGFASGSSSGDEEPEPTPTPAPQQATSGGDSGGGGGGGGGDSSSSTPARSVRTHTYQAESTHKVEGPYSGIVNGASGKVAKIASKSSLLSKNVTVTPDNYWLDVRVKHDRPGPVNVGIYLNNRAWKVIRLTKADNLYHTHRVGLLRNFRGDTIRFRLLNDTFNRAAPTDEEQDRNLFIDWWRLTTDDNAPADVAGTGGGTAGRPAAVATKSNGIALLPSLNTFIRQELGNDYVRLDIWQYYAKRLTVPANNPAAIQSEDHLRSVMRYWKGVRPDRPRGE